MNNKNPYIFISFLILSLFVYFFSNHFSPFYPFNYGYDSNAYMSMARGWMSGLIPYKDIFDHKGPILYIIYMLGCVITDTSFNGVYIISSIFLATSLFFIYKISRLFLSFQYAYTVSLLFIVITAILKAVDGSAESFTQSLQFIFLYIVFLFFTNNTNKKEYKLLYVIGILIGIIAFIKFNILVFCFFPLCAIIIQQIIKKDNINALKYILIITSGTLSVAIPILLYFYTHNALGDFIEVYFVFNKIYGNASLLKAIISFPYIFKLYLLPSCLIIIGLILFLTQKDLLKGSMYKVSIILAIIFTYISIYCTTNTIAYTYLPISTFVIFLFIAVLKYLEESRYNNRFYKYSILICLPICLLLCGYMYRGKIKSRDKFHFAQDISEYIQSKKHKKTDVRILQISLDQGLINLTQSLPYYKYFYQPNIERVRYPKISNSFEKYINSSTPPHYIYYVKPLRMKNTQSAPATRAFEQLLHSRYNLVKEYADYSQWPTYNEYLFELQPQFMDKSE